MNQNPGLTSRFPETVVFSGLPPRHCRDLLLQCLQKKQLDIKALEESTTLDSKLLDLFKTLSQTPSWGNARDVQTLARSVFSKIMKSKTPNPNRAVPEELVIQVVEAMIKERTDRAAATSSFNPMQHPPLPIQLQKAFEEPPPPPQVSTSIETETAPPEEKEEEPPKDKDGPENPAGNQVSIRDAGVSDAVWQQLQLDRLAAEKRRQELIESQRKAAELERKIKEKEEALKRERDEAKRREELRKLEEARRLKDIEDRKRKEKMEAMMREKQAQVKLRSMGICPAGFQWIKQEGGYRCSAGGHWVTDSQLGL